MTLLEYRLDAVMGFFGSFLYNIGTILFLKFLLSQIDSIAGWDFYDMVFLQGIGQTWAYFYFFFSYPSLHNFSDLVVNGDMDFILLKPMNSMFLATFRKVEFVAIASFLQPIAMVAYSTLNKNYSISFLSVILFSVSMLLSVIIVHLLEITIAASAFWTSRSELGRLFYRTAETVSYPYEIYKNKVIRFLFLTIVPYALIANVPFRTLINVLDHRLLLLQFGVLIMFFVIARLVWKAGLKRYQSASS